MFIKKILNYIAYSNNIMFSNYKGKPIMNNYFFTILNLSGFILLVGSVSGNTSLVDPQVRKAYGLCVHTAEGCNAYRAFPGATERCLAPTGGGCKEGCFIAGQHTSILPCKQHPIRP